MDGLTAVTAPVDRTEPNSRTEPFPLTDLQEGYLVGTAPLIELGGFQPNYYLELDLAGVDLRRAQDAVRRLISRHEHLRSVVLAEGGQRVLDGNLAASFPLPVVDLCGVDRDTQEAAIRQTRERMAEQGLDPTRWPLVEIVVNRLRPYRARVHIRMSLLLLDGRSLRLLMSEWQQLYRDPGASLPLPSLSHRECRLAMLAQESTDAYREQWRYWEARLDSLPAAPQLPLARQPRNIDPVRFTRRTLHLGHAQWQRLCGTFHRHRILPTAALLHVFAEVLGGWAASPRFCLNVLHQGPVLRHPDWAGTVGQLGATLPLEVDLSQGGDFWRRGQRLQRQLWSDLNHGDVTAVRITRELAVRRGWMPRAALPYVFTSALGGPGTVSGRPACRMVSSSLQTPQVLIDNQVQYVAGGVTCVWDVVDDAYPPGLADTMFEAYRDMLAALSRPDAGHSRPDPVPGRHRRLVAAINRTAEALPVGRLEDGFLRHAAAAPHAPAVVASGRVMTYAELEAESRAVAGWLRARDVGRGDLVPVVMVKGWEQVVAVLGVLRAGAAYCPVDADLPPERIRHLLDEGTARVVLGQSHRPDATADVPVEVLHVDQVKPDGNPLPAPEGDGDDLAYVIYTSGSTGLPKGVMIEHRSALNTILDINRRVGLDHTDRVFGISSLSFDLSVWDIFGTLAAGATLILPDATARPDPIGWAAAAAGAYGVTVWNSVPALAEMLVEVVEQWPEAGRPPVRAFLVSGDWIPTALPHRMRRLWPGVRVVAMGGATEAAIWSNSYEIGEVDPAWRSIPYGTPLANQTMRVLDHRLAVRPPWATGRIYIGGAGLARGYWRDEERTAQRFVRHPATGERLYWTGDLGRYRPDGVIEFLGREDRQLKIQGFRVEPGEVESAIRALPGVRECVVCAEDLPGGGRRLVALVVPGEGAGLDPGAIDARLRARLPYYLVPGRIEVMAHLPLTSNGKVDLGRAVGGAVTTHARAGTGPGTDPADGELVRRLSEVWAELLQVPEVGPDDDFFGLGGNSLVALRLVNRVRAELSVDLPFGQVFEAPTVRALAGRIAGGAPGGGCAVTLSAAATTAGAPELFLFHPVGGSAASYAELAHAWPGPVRAFQSPALIASVGAGLDPDLPAMAARYREELRRLAPRGPYLLGGWSMGGVLAYEVGRLLAGEGESARVVMIDSDLRNVRLPDTEPARHLEFLRDLAAGRLPAAAVDAIRAAPVPALARVARDVAVRYGLLPGELDLSGYQRLMGVHTHNLAVLGAYRPGRFELPALLLVAGEVDRSDPVPAWRAVCPGIEVEVWPCDHYSIVGGEQAAAIAVRITGWLVDSGQPVPIDQQEEVSEHA